ncbi:hypothetical protein DW999_18660 [Ruminococcus sp. AM54-14NS]|nr:hypothetical protein DW999_18660 [Ruminococcus sp. AM54-14NS]
MFCFVEQLCIPDCGEVAKKAEAEAVFKELLASCTSRLARTTLGSDPMRKLYLILSEEVS